MDLLAVRLFLGLVALFAIRAWKAQARLSARDRWASITSFGTAIATFVLAPLLINWVMVPAAIERRQTFVCWWELVRLILEPTSFARVKGDH